MKPIKFILLYTAGFIIYSAYYAFVINVNSDLHRQIAATEREIQEDSAYTESLMDIEVENKFKKMDNYPVIKKR